MELLGERIKLKAADESDVSYLYDTWDDPEYKGDFASVEPKKSLKEIEEMVRSLKGRLFIILTLSDSRKIGLIDYYWTRSDYPYLFEIGYRIMPSERRKGYTTEAAGLIIDFIFTTHKEVERIESITETGNIASQRVMEKNGLKREGLLRKRSLNVSGEYRDEYIYGLLREDWESLRAKTSPEMHQPKS